MNKKIIISLTAILLILSFFMLYSNMPLKKTIYHKDQLNTIIHELDNGLKLYMSVYKDAPRIQTNIAIKAGSKYDPNHATGLAHYLEHMLFKGTDIYGTNDYEKEKVLLDKIENLYEDYRKIDMKDVSSRELVWDKIDSLSNEAAKYAIPNEYDKMLSSIGAKGTNAYTSLEKTVYVNDIPSNQLEKWLKIEAERFRKPVFRLFHTELETVYEEKNRTLDNDGRKLFYEMMSGLFVKHQYGTQTTIGTIDHLKNPSIKEIQKYFEKYYVPNNMAICISGDFEPKEVINLTEKYFGNFKRAEVEEFVPAKEEEITQPIIKHAYGPESERLYMAFRFPGVHSKDALKLKMVDMILSNRTAGLIDLNLNQEQKVIGGGCFPYILQDYSLHAFYGSPKQNQTLEEVKDLLLNEIKNIKEGNFPEWLLPAIISDLKLEQIKNYETNNGRAGEFVESFTLDVEWDVYAEEINYMSKLTKNDLVEFANKYYKDNYVLVYKHTGVDESIQKVNKPKITPVDVNRDLKSEFLTKITEEEVKNIQPVFINFDEDIKKEKINEVDLLYKKNNENQRFKIEYIIKKGTNDDPKTKIAVEYFNFIGSDNINPSDKKQEFYKLGCDLNINCNYEETKISLTGINDNFEKSLNLLEDLLKNPVADEEALQNLKIDVLKKRNDSKLNKNTILFSGMRSYARYGKESPFSNVLSDFEIQNLKSQDLIEIIKNLTTNDHIITYYGSCEINNLKNKLKEIHTNTQNLNKVSEEKEFKELEINRNKIFIVNYDMKQAEVLFFAKGPNLQIEEIPLMKFHNEYFGGGMSSIVFQEMRESKALAYSVYSTYTIPSEKDNSHYSFSYIGTQADKLSEGMQGMFDLLNDMPEAKINMENARNGIIQKTNTERITKSKVINQYLKAEKMGLNYDIRKDIYNGVKNFQMNDLVNFHNNYIKNDNYTIMILGNKDALDLEKIKKYGEIEFLTLTDVFGY
ncbi:MAG: peptidase M16 [Flavobacteriales bacterium]|nr:peptidase M16 [Flavobacteriales bacterium]